MILEARSRTRLPKSLGYAHYHEKELETRVLSFKPSSNRIPAAEASMCTRSDGDDSVIDGILDSGPRPDGAWFLLHENTSEEDSVAGI